jgi:hypothetical protein
MKTLNIPLEDKEFSLLERKKGDLTWHDFIMSLIKEDKDVKL